jgi:hypothetical protein
MILTSISIYNISTSYNILNQYYNLINITINQSIIHIILKQKLIYNQNNNTIILN